MKKLIIPILLLPLSINAQNLFQKEIDSQNNDVEVKSNNTVNFVSSDLELHGKDGTVSQETYLRFENVKLPSDAVINSAYLVFYGKENSSSPTVIQISGEIGNSSAYPTSTSATTGTNIKSRNYTSSFTEWTTTGCIINQEYQSPDIKTLLEQMFPAGINDASIAFRLKGNEQGAFTVKSFSAPLGQRPKLVINYWSLSGNSSVAVASSKDDAKETNSGTMSLAHAYHNLGGRTDGQKSALRFENVSIPANVQITDAYIEFYSFGTSPAGNIDVYSEIGNPLAYDTSKENISKREYSANKVTWTTSAWPAAKTKYRTPNLKSIIDENRLSGWTSGQSIAFKFEGHSTDRPATVYSFDGNVSYSPKLVIEYLNNDQGASIEGAITDPALMTKLYINEVSSQGTSIQGEDWIELYNDSDSPLHIKGGVYLSDKSNNKTLSELKNVFIAAKGYTVLLADNNPQAGTHHLNFSLSNSGESLFLSRSVVGNILSQDQITFGKIPFNQSFGRLSNGNGNFTNFILPTYKASNANGKQRLDLSLSNERGIYDSGFNLNISVPAGTTIKYTLDGKYPSETTGNTYSNPISIDKTSVVKIYAYDSLGNNSGVISNTYILRNNYINENATEHSQWEHKSNITADEYAQAMSKIPIVSVSGGVEPSHTKWEQASIEYLDSHIYNNRKNFYSNSMTKKFGQESVVFYNPNIKFKFNSEAGVKKADYPFFDPYPGDAFQIPDKISTIELKQGQDNASRNVFNLGFMRWSEKISMNLQKEMKKYALETKYVQLFINGKYRGLKTMRNDFNTNNIAEVFGDSNKNYTKINLQDAHFTEGTVEDGDGSKTVWSTIKNAANSKDFQQFKNLVDVDDLIKFQIMYMMTDTEKEAIAITHNTNSNILKAKFMINDTDGSFFGGITHSSSDISMPSRTFAGGGGNYKHKWESDSSRNGPGKLFGQFMGSNTSATAGNLEFKTLVKDAVLKYIGSASGSFSGNDGAVLSVGNIQKKMSETINELDLLYKVDAAYMGFDKDVYKFWKNVDYPRILAQTPERVSYNLKKWLEYNMAHTLYAANIVSVGSITTSESIIIENPNPETKLYYTINGTDPMGDDGTPSSAAKLYSSQFTLAAGKYNIVTRALTTNNWGPKSEKAIKVESSNKGQFIITGINYKPQTNEDAEFIMISNSGNADLDVSGYSISDAFKYTFPKGTMISKGSTVMIVKKASLINSFKNYTKYEWTGGSLSNEGESITFKDASGNIVDQVSYLAAAPWPSNANGQGYYLELISEEMDNNLPQSWKAKSLPEMITTMDLQERETTTPVKESGNIKVYPNPVKDILYINIEEKSTVTIYDTNGQIVEEKSFNSGKNSVNVSNFKSGIYLLTVTGTQNKKTFRILKH